MWNINVKEGAGGVGGGGPPLGGKADLQHEQQFLNGSLSNMERTLHLFQVINLSFCCTPRCTQTE